MLENTGGTAARDIAWEFENVDDDPHALPGVGSSDSTGSLPVLSAGGSAEETIHAHMGSARRFLCRLRWLDGDHERQDEITLVL